MVGELEVGELKKVPVDIKKLSDVVDKDIIKKIVYDQLVTKVDVKDGKILSKTKLRNENMMLINKFHKKIGNVDKKYYILVLEGKKLIITEKLNKMKMKYQIF